MYRYDNYTDSFVRIDGEPNTGSTTIRVGVPLKEAVTIKKVELTDECIEKIADAVVRKLADRKTEPTTEDCSTVPTISKMEQVDKDINVRSKDEPLKDKPTTQTETQNSNLTFEKRTMRDCYNCKRYETEGECIECHYEPKDEPQTDCAWK